LDEEDDDDEDDEDEDDDDEWVVFVVWLNWLDDWFEGDGDGDELVEVETGVDNDDDDDITKSSVWDIKWPPSTIMSISPVVVADDVAAAALGFHPSHQ
jgi:hypothetical protein